MRVDEIRAIIDAELATERGEFIAALKAAIDDVDVIRRYSWRDNALAILAKYRNLIQSPP